jgi:hypothetical protein
MTCTAAALRDATAFDRRAGLAGYRRTLWRGAVAGLAAVTALAVMGGAVTMLAAWIVAGCFRTNPYLQARAPVPVQTAALPRPDFRLADAANETDPDFTGSVGPGSSPSGGAAIREGEHLSGEPLNGEHLAAAVHAAALSVTPRLPDRRSVKGDRLPLKGDRLTVATLEVPLPAQRPPRSRPIQAQNNNVSGANVSGDPAEPALPQAAIAEPSPAASAAAQFNVFDPAPMSVAALTAAPAGTLFLPNRFSSAGNDAPSPPVRRPDNPPGPAPRQVARIPAAPPLPRVAAATPAALESRAPASGFAQKRLAPQQARTNLLAFAGPDSRTAIYDIAAHTVYLPNGLKLEAHSGLGRRLDDPRFVDEKDRGPTPPNIYDLALREESFHGVRAIRLNPVNDAKMHGRDGILAHTYMLGATGQSFGCVSFKNYQAFLNAFLKGEIDRLVVVPHLGARPPHEERAGRGTADRYADNNR